MHVMKVNYACPPIVYPRKLLPFQTFIVVMLNYMLYISIQATATRVLNNITTFVSVSCFVYSPHYKCRLYICTNNITGNTESNVTTGTNSLDEGAYSMTKGPKAVRFDAYEVKGL